MMGQWWQNMIPIELTATKLEVTEPNTAKWNTLKNLKNAKKMRIVCVNFVCSHIMNCCIIMSLKTVFKATIWWSLTTQMHIFLQNQTQFERIVTQKKRWKLQPFYLDLTLKLFYTCSLQSVLILFETILNHVLNILCKMLSSHLNRKNTMEKKDETCCSGKGPIDRTQQCHHPTCFMIITNMIQQETS